jgi:hypothetical protein
MKNTSNYYKKKKVNIFSIITEYNDIYILPTIRIHHTKFFQGRGFDRLYLEFSWLNKTFAIKLK